ncbi:hypothetical protein OBBRIDRAFT_8420 [Obba rivulosa]|uniref:Uncharacterized protein n=1 Tax=Obba rivulosa TaxID=1052685 RepID=A0A8E2DV13_9APHY|nr:hypothetical protein OBBRIDRAFT_8420 [Obba rivulosa]
MLSDSDTEPESETYEQEHDIADFMGRLATTSSPAATDGDSSPSIAARSAQVAVEALRGLVIPEVETDIAQHEVIKKSSNALLLFLENVIAAEVESVEDLRIIQATVCALLDTSFLAVLFEFRQIFHVIASRSVAPGGASLVVCWVDVVLVKLSDAVVVIAGGIESTTGEPELVTLRRQREEDMLRAAIQLPETWRGVATMISSRYASPAAKRLGLRILFGAYILGPELEASGPRASDGLEESDFLCCLQLHVEGLTVVDVVINPMDALEVKVNYAMLVALFATADLERAKKSAKPYRPHTDSSLLRLLCAIMSCDRSSGPLQPTLDPYSKLDAAQHMVIDASHVVPWSWSVWNDPRMEGFHAIEFMTVNWLHSRGTSTSEMSAEDWMERWEEELAPDLLQDCQNSVLVILRIIAHACFSLSATHNTSTHGMLDVLSKCSWAVSRFLSLRELDVRLEIELSCCLCKLYMLLQDSKVELDNMVIQGLVSLDTETFQGAIQSLYNDKQVIVTSWLEERMRRVRVSIADRETRRSLSGPDYRSIRQLLQFVTMISYNDIIECFFGDAISAFLRALVHWMASVPSNAACSATLRDALILCLAVMKVTSSSSDPDDVHISAVDEAVWELAVRSPRSDLLVASTFATYIIQTCPSTGNLPVAFTEAWSYLNDVLLLVISRQFFDEAEPLALLVCNSVCTALDILLKYPETNNAKCFLSSPWTTSLYVGLEAVLSQGQLREEPYFKFLNTRLVSSTEGLMRDIIRTLNTPCGPRADVPKRKELLSLTSCHIAGLLRLLPHFI